MKNNEVPTEDFREEEDEEITYEEILANLQLSGEVTITLLPEDADKAKIGLRNLKAKQIARLVKEGLPATTDEFLEFKQVNSVKHRGYLDINIRLLKKGAIRIKRMIVPDSSL